MGQRKRNKEEEEVGKVWDKGKGIRRRKRWGKVWDKGKGIRKRKRWR